jgi:hypothetical protein
MRVIHGLTKAHRLRDQTAQSFFSVSSMRPAGVDAARAAQFVQTMRDQRTTWLFTTLLPPLQRSIRNLT